MMENLSITKVKFAQPLPGKKRVCAYARVSTGKDSMLHSLSCQISHYSTLIQSRSDWAYCGVYADEAISGTKNNREQFLQMMEAARKGELDIIITKSISRFARNTVALLEAVRELKKLKVDVYFEEQNLHSLSKEGELMLTILASYAQEEARSASENVNWKVQKSFEEGKVYSMTILGYRLEDGVLIINKEESKIIKLIFALYLTGLGPNGISKELNKKGFKTRFGNNFTPSTIFSILRNETYMGDVTLQKTYRKDYMSKKSFKNNGERNKIHVENAHEPIISKECFEEVQEEIARRQALAPYAFKKREVKPFTKMLVCEHCGRHLIPNKCREVLFWRCSTYDKLGKDACPSKKVPEIALIKSVNEVLEIKEFNKEYFKEVIDHILVKDNNILVFYFKDGKTKESHWEDISRRNSWTPEMKAAMSMKIKEITKGNPYGKKNNGNSSEQ